MERTLLTISSNQILSDARRGEFPKELAGSPELLLLQDMLHRNPEVKVYVKIMRVMILIWEGLKKTEKAVRLTA